MDRSEIIQRLQAQIRVNGHIIGAAVGSGMTAKYVAMGGADFLLALSAGKYRLMGRSSYAGYLACGNNNEIVMELGTKELFPILPDMYEESAASYTKVFDQLKERGLEKVWLVVSDAHKGLVKAARESFLGCSWQRCKVHFMRNILAHDLSEGAGGQVG